DDARRHSRLSGVTDLNSERATIEFALQPRPPVRLGADWTSQGAQIPPVKPALSRGDYAWKPEPQALGVAPPSARPVPDLRRAARARAPARPGARAARRPWRGRACARGR